VRFDNICTKIATNLHKGICTREFAQGNLHKGICTRIWIIFTNARSNPQGTNEY